MKENCQVCKWQVMRMEADRREFPFLVHWPIWRQSSNMLLIKNREKAFNRAHSDCKNSVNKELSSVCLCRNGNFLEKSYLLWEVCPLYPGDHCKYCISSGVLTAPRRAGRHLNIWLCLFQERKKNNIVVMYWRNKLFLARLWPKYWAPQQFSRSASFSQNIIWTD